MTEDDFQFRVVDALARLETKVDSFKESLAQVESRVTTLERDTISRSGVLSAVTILGTLFGGAGAYLAEYFMPHR